MLVIQGHNTSEVNAPHVLPSTPLNSVPLLNPEPALFPVTGVMRRYDEGRGDQPGVVGKKVSKFIIASQVHPLFKAFEFLKISHKR